MIAEGIDPETVVRTTLRDAIRWEEQHDLPPAVGATEPIAPLTAEYLFYLWMSRQNAEAITGDLEEGYKALRKKFGRRRANFWYWTQTGMSLGPIVWAWAKKVSLKPVVGLVTWAVAKGLIGRDGWMAALVELWKRVRS